MFTSLHYQFRLGISTISTLVIDMCRDIWDALVREVMLAPTEEMWLHSAERFRERCDLPNCVGALDGKHVQVIRPRNSGSAFYNYKGTYSVVLMAIVNTDYKFMTVSVGVF